MLATLYSLCCSPVHKVSQVWMSSCYKNTFFSARIRYSDVQHKDNLNSIVYQHILPFLPTLTILSQPAVDRPTLLYWLDSMIV